MIHDERLLAATRRVDARMMAVADEMETVDADRAMLLFAGMGVDGDQMLELMWSSAAQLFALAAAADPARVLSVLHGGIARAALLGFELGRVWAP